MVWTSMPRVNYECMCVCMLLLSGLRFPPSTRSEETMRSQDIELSYLLSWLSEIVSYGIRRTVVVQTIWRANHILWYKSQCQLSDLRFFLEFVWMCAYVWTCAGVHVPKSQTFSSAQTINFFSCQTPEIFRCTQMHCTTLPSPRNKYDIPPPRKFQDSCQDFAWWNIEVKARTC